MTEISFYILESETADAAERYACRLAEELRASRRRVYIQVADDTAAERLDALMWTFRQNSFVPHLRAAHRDADDRRTPILIGSGRPPDDFDDRLINLGGDVSTFFSRFTHHNEIVDTNQREAARGAYRFYRDRGYELTTHRVSAADG